MTQPPAIAFVTLGCPKNEVDTDRMRAAVVQSAFGLAEQPSDADIVVINTCAFIREATEESLGTIFSLANESLPDRADRALIVTGCLPSRYGRDLDQQLPEVAALLPVAEEGDLLATIERITGVSAGRGVRQSASDTSAGARDAVGASAVSEGDSAMMRTDSEPSAYLRISDGCHRACAYCTIPAIRGPHVSAPLDAIVAEARQLVALGAREIVLVGQDITAWGRDLDGAGTLADVVRAVSAVRGVAWVRLMYVQPDGVTDELLEVMASASNVCHYLDMPLQHASATVLRSMGRRGSGVDFLSLIARIRAILPDVVLRTTLIAGFPGETRDDVKQLHAFMQEARFDYIGVFAYSPEEGTTAAEMPDQVPPRTRRARAQRLRDVADEIGFEKAAEQIGRTHTVLVEGVDEDGSVVGRWCGQAPEIDGVVVLDRGSAGEIVSARILDSLGYDLEGEVF